MRHTGRDLIDERDQHRVALFEPREAGGKVCLEVHHLRLEPRLAVIGLVAVDIVDYFAVLEGIESAVQVLRRAGVSSWRAKRGPAVGGEAARARAPWKM